jgi:hypothetical protein
MDWAIKISATHIVFPMIGYYGVIILLSAVPQLTAILGLAATGVLAYFLWNLIKEWSEPHLSTMNNEDGLDFKKYRSGVVPFSVVIAVSLDALFSGPAKSAQAVGWNNTEVLFSFPISGLVVGGMALGSLYFARLLYQKVLFGGLVPKSQIPLWETFGQYLEFAILSYFAWLSLARYVFVFSIPDIYIFCFSMVIAGLIFAIFTRKIYGRTIALFELSLRGESSNDDESRLN